MLRRKGIGNIIITFDITVLPLFTDNFVIKILNKQKESNVYIYSRIIKERKSKIQKEKGKKRI